MTDASLLGPASPAFRCLAASALARAHCSLTVEPSEVHGSVRFVHGEKTFFSLVGLLLDLGVQDDKEINGVIEASNLLLPTFALLASKYNMLLVPRKQKALLSSYADKFFKPSNPEGELQRQILAVLNPVSSSLPEDIQGIIPKDVESIFDIKTIIATLNASSIDVIYAPQLRDIEEHKRYYLTTPIYYVNAVPHIGHMYTTTLADSLARWHKLRGRDVFFLTGTDEHGLKVQQAAEKKQLTPKEHCDIVSQQFKECFAKCGIEYNRFIRTTDEDHIKTAMKLWEILDKNGYIYKGSYSGWYCSGDEAFLPQAKYDVIKDKDGKEVVICKEHKTPCENIIEENYLFKLSAFKDQLIKYIDTEPYPVAPESRRQDILRLLRSPDGLKDISISRLKKNLSWGIPVPGDDEQVMYVWIDALANYLTAVDVFNFTGEHESWWPADVHIIGKDIMKFHCIYWPAMLMGAGLPLPKLIHVHGWWTKNKEKISKSTGNTLDPFDIVTESEWDKFRYFMLREATPEIDADFSDMSFKKRINSELANTLGNLVLRCLSDSLNKNGELPKCGQISDKEKDLIDNINALPGQVEYYMGGNMEGCCGNVLSSMALEAIFTCANRINAYLQEEEPWKLCKSEEADKQERLQTVLYVATEALRIVGTCLLAFIPEKASTLLTQMGVPKSLWKIDKDTMFSTERSG